MAASNTRCPVVLTLAFLSVAISYSRTSKLSGDLEALDRLLAELHSQLFRTSLISRNIYRRVES
jgi:hypothetical protein